METKIYRAMVLFSSEVKGLGINHFINEGQNRLLEMMENRPQEFDQELDFYDGTITEVESEDILRPMPDWFSMSDQDVMKMVCYHRREAKNGSSRLMPMKDANGNLIPIKRDQDGMTIGYNRWSNEEPESSILRTAAKVGTILENQFSIDMGWLDQEIQKLRESQCLTEMSPFKSAEDLVEAIKIRKMEDIDKSQFQVHKILTSWFGIVMANKVLKEARLTLEKSALDAMEIEDFDIKSEMCNDQTKTGQWIMIKSNWGTKKKWVENLDTTMGIILKAGRSRYGYDWRIEKDGWIKISQWINKVFWGIVTGSIHGHMSEAKETMIKVYASKMLQAEVMAILAEDQHVDRQIVDLKTDLRERYRPEQADWEWWMRE